MDRHDLSLGKRLASLALLLCIVSVALAFRITRLENRPMHADEAVQAAIFKSLWLQGNYQYNPDEFHGPTLSFLTLPLIWLQNPDSFSQCTKSSFRLVAAIFGTSIILLLFSLTQALGRGATVAAALLFALSPAMVFYHRYYIHETLFAFFTVAAIAAGWRYIHSGRFGWCLAAGAALGLMQATKETSVLVFFSMGGAILLTWGWNRISDDHPGIPLPVHWRRHVGFGLLAALLVAGLFLSSFCTNPRGVWDGLVTYLPWIRRAGGESPHIHPWHFYLRMLCWWQQGEGRIWTELPTLLLAGTGFLVSLLPGNRWLPRADRSFLRWLGFFTLLLLATYSAIPYKTPWCLLGPLTTLIVMAGVGASCLWRFSTSRFYQGLCGWLLVMIAGHLAWQAYHASFLSFTDPTSPYVYAQTSDDIERLSEDLKQLAEAAPSGNDVVIKVLWHDPHYWPLPWYVREFKQVGYWQQVPSDPTAPLVLASPQFDAQLIVALDETHLMTGYYEIRPHELIQLWVSLDLWKAHLRRLGRW